MKKFFVENAEILIYAAGLCSFITWFYTGVQLIQLSGASNQLLGGSGGPSPLIGIFVIVCGAVFSATMCLVLLAIMDIRTYTRHTAKMLNAR